MTHNIGVSPIRIGPFSIITQKKVRHFVKRYCNSIDIKLVFSSFKIGNMFWCERSYPSWAPCAGCYACYVSETTRHFSTRVHEHMFSDRASHIFKHLQNSQQCRTSCCNDCFIILDHTSTIF